MNKIWKHNKLIDTEGFNLFVSEVSELCKRAKKPTTPLQILRVLFRRGVKEVSELSTFFSPKLEQLHDPFLMKGMHEAVTRINQAIEKKEKIMVYGDYDVDGTTATAVTYDFLSNFTEEIVHYTPDRMKEGYGVSLAGIEYAASHSVSLIITLDCGIAAVESIRKANEKGIDVIVSDHHLPGKEAPPAYAVLDPQQEGCAYPYKHLSGCGVAFKMICAIASVRKLPLQMCYEYLDLVCLSIASDIVPVTGENRILAFWGLKKINENPSVCVKSMKKHAKLEGKQASIEDLVFRIGPAINASGRLQHASLAVKHLISKDADFVSSTAEQLFSLNDERRDNEKTIMKEAESNIEANDFLRTANTKVVCQAHWHKGVLGIVASKLVEKYRRPAIVLTKDKSGALVGSGRTVEKLNLFETLKQCQDFIIQYGGHQAAIGLTLEEDKLEAFRKSFEQAVGGVIVREEDFLEELIIEDKLAFNEITPLLLQYLKKFEPQGPENLKPVFYSDGVWLMDKVQIMNKEHAKVFLSQDQKIIFAGIGFGMADKMKDLQPYKSKCKIAYTVEENEWKDQKRIQLNLKDIILDE